MGHTGEQSPQMLTGLATIRNRRKVVWGMLAGYVPTMVAVSVVCSWLNLEWPVYVVAAGYFLAWFAAIQIVAHSSCPRCMGRFHSRSLWSVNPWRGRCANCQLPL